MYENPILEPDEKYLEELKLRGTLQYHGNTQVGNYVVLKWVHSSSRKRVKKLFYVEEKKKVSARNCYVEGTK